MDWISLLGAGLAGLFGSVIFLLANHILDGKDRYFTAFETLATGFVAGVIGILLLGYAVPTTTADVLPFLILGYFGSDIVQIAAAKLAASKPAGVP